MEVSATEKEEMVPSLCGQDPCICYSSFPIMAKTASSHFPEFPFASTFPSSTMRYGKFLDVQGWVCHLLAEAIYRLPTTLQLHSWSLTWLRDNSRSSSHLSPLPHLVSLCLCLLPSRPSGLLFILQNSAQKPFSLFKETNCSVVGKIRTVLPVGWSGDRVYLGMRALPGLSVYY